MKYRYIRIKRRWIRGEDIPYSKHYERYESPYENDPHKVGIDERDYWTTSSYTRMAMTTTMRFSGTTRLTRLYHLMASSQQQWQQHALSIEERLGVGLTMSYLDPSNDHCETSNATLDGDKEHVEFIDESIVTNDDNVDIVDNEEENVEIVDNVDIGDDNKESNNEDDCDDSVLW
ncbi:hypothetical protein Scep_016612 [Stephania cephalantha]|uniref:Uncharacterized protein n=1 Tax=Stephania cephalantha TaxID=152367 RepID=A0AAP0IMZ0_9MAGN